MTSEASSHNDRPVRIATLGAALLIAQQVGAKTARDSLFLESFDVSMLPRALAIAAGVTLVFVVAAGRLFHRFGPARVVPIALGGAALLQVATWFAFDRIPQAAAFGYYLLVAATGALLVSGFWSVVNESLDPNTARLRMGRIGTGATAGGLLGGLLALIVGRFADTEAVLLLLALLTVSAAFAVRALGRDSVVRSADGPRDLRGGWRVVRSRPFVRDLAILVVVITLGTACLDYVFKDFAQQRFASDEAPVDLVTFFGIFHTVTALLTLVLQSTLARPLLRSAGLVRTIATLPTGLAVGSLALLLVPLWPVAAAARLIEGALRSSLFRSAYEPLYTPLAPGEKRASKSLIDVGGERLGDALGALVVQVLLLAIPLGASFGGPTTGVLATATLAGVGALVVARRLHRGYVDALEDSLARRHVELAPNDAIDSTTRTMVLRTNDGGRPRPTAPAPGAVAPPASKDPIVRDVQHLRSRDATVVLRTLATAAPLPSELIGHAVPLLAWDAVAESAIMALRSTGPRVIGPLVSALLDEDEDFSVRRRSPRAMPNSNDPLVVEALLRGLTLDRFEIRFQCARALDRIRGETGVAVPRDRILDCVRREVAVGDGVWHSHRLLDGRSPGPLFADSMAARRVGVGLQHVFGLLGLVLPADAVRLTLEGLLTDDATLRGTALEYLESVLPADLRADLWPRLDAVPSTKDAAPADPETALQSLLMTRQEIESALLRRNDDD